MYRILLLASLLFSGLSHQVQAQYLSPQQEYLLREMNDALGGQVYYAWNLPKAQAIFNQLVQYSGQQYPIVFGQTFQWGQAHHGGLIILDYSTINKPSPILAFVFAHEWGHQSMGHQANFYNPQGSMWRYRSSPTQFEDEADVYAGRFLAQFGYDVSQVMEYLRNLPNFDDHTHSSGSQRAALVLSGYRQAGGSVSSGPESYREVRVPCTHPAHSSGDLVNCQHLMHPGGDLYPCQHSCWNGYQYVPCHAQGDAFSCQHLAHPSGDYVQCQHAAHPSGDIQRVGN